MFEKRPTWTRTRVGRNRVHWVAYDDRPGGDDPPQIVDQGYATGLNEADAAARAALAEQGIYQARRMSKGFGPPIQRDRATPEAAPKPARPPRPAPVRPRAYLYTRHPDDGDDQPLVAAHLIVKQTARRVYVSRQSCGPDQLGTEDETWGENEPTISLDRSKLERDGSAFAGSYRQSEFYPTREAAEGDTSHSRPTPFEHLGISPPCTVAEIKAAYRLKAFAVHPDRGGSQSDFRLIEAAYRRLLREAQTPEP